MILLVVVSWIVRASDLDRFLQYEFWSPFSGWKLSHETWVRFLYRFGAWPALIVAGSGLAVWLISYFVSRLKPMRLFGGFLALAMILGPGLLVNGMFKEYYGRPRPRQVIEFGGSQTFLPLGDEPTFDQRGKSFPSGHASTGFFWFAPCVHFWQRHRRVALGFAALALVHGGLMSFARMAQGAHWLSDNLWAGGTVYLSSWVLHRGLAYPSRSANPRAGCAGTLPRHPGIRGRVLLQSQFNHFASSPLAGRVERARLGKTFNVAPRSGSVFWHGRFPACAGFRPASADSHPPSSRFSTRGSLRGSPGYDRHSATHPGMDYWSKHNSWANRRYDLNGRF